MNVYDSISKAAGENRKQLAVLIDPDKACHEKEIHIARERNDLGIDYFFVGGSLLMNGDIERCTRTLSENSNIPVVIFPGNTMQVSRYADAILFLSLISGRNPEMLIGQHVIAAPKIKNCNLEAIPAGYMLINCGALTSAHYMSNTLPIPHNKKDIAICTAMAGEMLGMKSIYLDAGSGADMPVPAEMVQSIKEHIKLPLIVGGGICNSSQATELWQAGANIIVTGNAAEKNPELIKQLVEERNQLNRI